MFHFCFVANHDHGSAVESVHPLHCMGVKGSKQEEALLHMSEINWPHGTDAGLWVLHMKRMAIIRSKVKLF